MTSLNIDSSPTKSDYVGRVLTYSPADNKVGMLGYTEKTIHTGHGKMYYIKAESGHSIKVTDDHSLATIGTGENFFGPLPPVDALGKIVPIPLRLSYADDDDFPITYNPDSMLTWKSEHIRTVLEESTTIYYSSSAELAEYQFLLFRAGLYYTFDDKKITVDKDFKGYVPEDGKLVKREEAKLTNMYRLLPFTWSTVVESKEIEREEVTYDFTVPEFPLFIGNFILVYDTMQLHVPATEGARQDALNKMLPSKNLFSVRDLEPMMLPQQEHLFGVYLAAKPSSAKPITVSSASEARQKIETGAVKPNNPCVYKGKQTTVGLVWINDALPEDLRNYGTKWDKGTLKGILSKLGKTRPTLYTRAADHIKEVGSLFSYLLGASFTASDFDLKDLKKKRDKVFDHIETQLGVIDKSSLTKSEKYKKKVDLLRGAQSVSQKLTDDATTNNFQQWAYSGSRGSKSQVMQIVSSPTIVSDPRDRVIPMLIRKSYNEGLTPTEYWISSYGTRKGTVGAKLSVAPGGALAKELIANALDIVVSERDCHSKEGISIPINSTQDILERYEAGSNRLIDARYYEQLKKAGRQTVLVRSPAKCHSKNGVCQLCYGHNEKGLLPEIGDNVGVQTAQALSEPLTQMGLSAKHTAGTAAAEKVGLSTIKQFFAMSNQYEGAAVIADAPGRVASIEPSPTGGQNIVIMGARKKRYHVIPGREIKVKVGDMIKAGDILTNGLPNIAKIVPHKGIDHARDLFVHHGADLYNRAGVPAVQKNFEIMSRAMVNYVQIDDPGDFEFIPGDTVDYNHLRAEIAERKRANPNVKLPKFRPIQGGITWAPQFKQDWMANLGFKYLKTNLIDNAIMGNKSQVHSYHPIAAYAHGSEFGDSTNGKY